MKMVENILAKYLNVKKMKIVKITYKELQKWKAARYDNQVIKNILAKHLNVKSSEIDDYDQVNYGLTFEVWLVEVDKS
jgi:hypothetical protein